MKRGKLFIEIFFISVMTVSLGFLALRLPGILKMYEVKRAISAGGFPVQTGLTKTSKIQCQYIYCSAVPCACQGGTLCLSVPVAQCITSSEISGTSAGGTNQLGKIIINTMQEAASGYTAGNSIIAGGTTMMNTSVIATPNGCSGCGT